LGGGKTPPFFKNMNIIYCYDNNYKDLVKISQESFKKHNPDARFFEITEDEEGILKEFTSELCGYSHVSKASFLRLLIPKVFPELERALYVDCDTLCFGSISELYNADFEKNYLIACKGHSFSDKQAKQLDLPYYVNSGVLLFNIPLMNKDDYFKQILDNWKGAIGKQEPFSADETVINWVFHNKIKLVPEKWNYCYERDYGERLCATPKILHIIGPDKRKMYESDSINLCSCY